MASIEDLAELASTGLLAADPNIFSHISSAMQSQSRVLLCTMIAATHARKARNCTKKPLVAPALAPNRATMFYRGFD
jgi:hypothetical protein